MRCKRRCSAFKSFTSTGISHLWRCVWSLHFTSSHPIELIKCKMQVPFMSPSRSCRAPGPLALILAVYRHHGILGFWHGQLGTLIRETGGSAAWFEATKPLPPSCIQPWLFSTKDKSTLPIYQQMLAGATAGELQLCLLPGRHHQITDANRGSVRTTKGGRRTFWP
jgi:ornithine carrier protein